MSCLIKNTHANVEALSIGIIIVKLTGPLACLGLLDNQTSPSTRDPFSNVIPWDINGSICKQK